MALKWYNANSDQAQILLRHGHLMATGERWVAHQVSGDQIGFDQPQGSAPKPLVCWFTAIRAISLTATLMPALATLLWLSLSGFNLDMPVALSAVIGVLLLQVAVNLFNDVQDYYKLIDLPGSLGGSGVIQQGWLSAHDMNRAAWLCLIAGIGFGVPALLKAPEWILACGSAAVLGVVGYSGWPLRMKYRAMGDFAVLLLCGPVLTFGIAAAALGYGIEDVEGLMSLGVFFGFAATAILNANNINDIPTDTARGSVTLAAKLGFLFARHWQAGYYLLAGLALLSLQMYPLSTPWMLLPLLATPLILMQLRALYGADHPAHDSLNEVRFQAAKTHLLLGVLLCVGLLIGLVGLEQS